MGYVNDTHMSQYIPPTAFHPAGATWTWVAGQVANTIALHRAAASATVIFTIPVMIPSNASPLKGAYLKSVEIDYEITAGAATGLTFLIHKVTRAVEGAAIGAPAAQAFTQSPTVAIADDVDEHRMVLTLTTPIWIDNDEYVLVQGTLVAGASAVLDLYSAVANFTLRL